MGLAHSQKKLGDIDPRDHLDEDLVSVNSLDAHDLHDLDVAKEFRPRRLPKFQMTVPDDIGKVLEGHSIMDSKSLQHTVADISRLKDQAYETMEFENHLHFKHHLMRRIHLALRRETERVEKRREAKDKSIKDALRKMVKLFTVFINAPFELDLVAKYLTNKRLSHPKVPPLSAGAKIGIQTVAELFVQNVQYLTEASEMKGEKYLRNTLNVIFRLLRQMTPLSICDGKQFSPDVAVGLEPVLSLFRQLADITDEKYKGVFVNRGVESLSRFALARGTVSDVLSLIEVSKIVHSSTLLSVSSFL
eukprot:1344278-Amorphochlora_amoeboformis.AAC.2